MIGKALKEWRKRRLVKKTRLEANTLEAGDGNLFCQSARVLGLADYTDTFQLPADLEFGSVFRWGYRSTNLSSFVFLDQEREHLRHGKINERSKT